MALYCIKCSKEIARITPDMNLHFTACYGDLPEEVKVAAKASPKLMSESYFTTEKPAGAYPKQKEVIWDALLSDVVRPGVQALLAGILKKPNELAQFEYTNFAERLRVSGKHIAPLVYFRKMAQGEFDASIDGRNQNGWNPFKAAFNFFNTDNYRYWVSSSEAKCRAFGNENSTDAGGVLVKITFSSSPLGRFTIKAHQEPNVQADSTVVAIHREGFAEIGTISSAQQVSEITSPNPKLDHNLGFTSQQSAVLKNLQVSFEQWP